ncbi:hypothetical protein, partial [Actinocorallia lasiicapitis]
MTRPRLTAVAILLLLVVGLAVTCSPRDRPTTVSVLASSDLRDLEPVLPEIEEDTGLRLAFDYAPTLSDSELESGRYHHDLAWISSDRLLKLRLQAAGIPVPPRVSTMLSPVAVGLAPEAAARLRQMAGHTELTWADIADGAARGLLRFAMADPRT